MRKRVVLLAVCLMAIVSVAAQTQTGYVKTKGRLASNGTVIAGKRLSGVSVQVKGLTSAQRSVVSNTNGDFSFPVPSQEFYLQSVKKSGYVLNDPEQLKTQYAYSKNPLVVVLVTPSEQLDEQLSAERKARRALNRELQRKEDELEMLKEENKISLEQYRVQLQELYQKQVDNEKLIRDMAERYSKIDYDALDDFGRKFSTYFLNGDFDKADSLVNTKGDINVAVAKLKQLRDELDKKKRLEQYESEEIARRCDYKFELFKARHENDSAAYYIELRASIDPNIPQWQLVAGNFIQNYIADYDKALKYYQTALNLSIAKYGVNHPDVATCYSYIGSIYNCQGKYSEALEYIEKSLAIKSSVYGENHTDIAVSYNNIGAIYNSQGKYSEALEYYQKSLDIMLSNNGENYLAVVACYNNIGTVYRNQGKYAEALEAYQKSLAMRLSIYGENHPNVATCYHNIGSIYESQGKYAEALAFYQKALDINLPIYGENHPDVAIICICIGSVYESQGKYAEALKLGQKALEIMLSIYGENHPNVAISYNNIGSIYQSQGKNAKALKYFQKSLAIELPIYGENHANVATSYNNIGTVYYRQGKYAEALEHYQKALAIRLSIYGENHPDVATIYNNIGAIYDSQGIYAEALVYYQKALEIMLSIYGENHPDVAISYTSIGLIKYINEDYRNAIESLTKALTLYKTNLQTSNEEPAVANVVYLSYHSLFSSGDADEAVIRDYKEFMSDYAIVAAVGDVEGYLLNLADWNIDSFSEISDYIDDLNGKKKTLVMELDGKVTTFQLGESDIPNVNLKYVGKEEKQRLKAVYSAWRRAQK